MPEMFEISAELIRETGEAYLIFDGTQEVWVPKSQVERLEDRVFNVPVWLAEKKGLI